MKLKPIILIVLLAVGLPFAHAKKEIADKSRFEKLELFNKVIYLIENQYYRQVDEGKLIQGAIKGMMNTLDPHSAYLDPDLYQRIQEDTKGEFAGLGIEVTQKDGIIVITTPIEDTPADKAGLMPGDKIVEIEGENAIGLPLEEATQKMKGKAGTKVTIGIARDGVDGVKQYTLTRKVIKVSAVKSKLLKSHYAYIRLTQFQEKGSKQIVKAIKNLRKSARNKNLKGIVLDLRYNPGGLLQEAVNVSSIFLKDGIVVSTEYRDPKHKEIHYVKKIGHKELDIPVVVLINGASASASEIVAGALQDSSRAIIMGTPSFGKGSVQSVINIDKDKGVKLTVAQYMTPSGKKIQAIGIKPDIFVDEYEQEWTDDNKKLKQFMREKDLANHLTATIETEEEKKLREKEEKEERRLRAEELKRQRNARKNKNKKKSFKPDSDYQVYQAVNYLEALPRIKNIIN
jgi:carboxyl-terminal processing protease